MCLLGDRRKSWVLVVRSKLLYFDQKSVKMDLNCFSSHRSWRKESDLLRQRYANKVNGKQLASCILDKIEVFPDSKIHIKENARFPQMLEGTRKLVLNGAFYLRAVFCKGIWWTGDKKLKRNRDLRSWGETDRLQVLCHLTDSSGPLWHFRARGLGNVISVHWEEFGFSSFVQKVNCFTYFFHSCASWN